MYWSGLTPLTDFASDGWLTLDPMLCLAYFSDWLLLRLLSEDKKIRWSEKLCYFDLVSLLSLILLPMDGSPWILCSV